MIHVCFPDYDKSGRFSKYVGVAIESLLARTDSDVTVHLLHDVTLTSKNRKRFEQLVQKYHQSICFYEVRQKEFLPLGKKLGNLTIGTLFRLSMDELLPEDVNRIIYLDADILVNVDIEKLWNLDLQGYPIGAAVHEDFQGEGAQQVSDCWFCKFSGIPMDRYFNAGVLVMDLAKIRAVHDLKRECFEFLESHQEYGPTDQDALNWIFKDDYFQLPKKFNIFTRLIRGDGQGVREGIIHITGDFLDFSRPQWWDHLFLEYWLDSPWGVEEDVANYFCSVLEIRRQQIEAFQARLAHRGERMVVWGTKGRLVEEVGKIVPMNPSIDYFVDNDPSRQGITVEGLMVYPPNKLAEEADGDFIVIILAGKAYAAIRRELEQRGFQENVNFIDGRLFLQTEQGGYAGYL